MCAKMYICQVMPEPRIPCRGGKTNEGLSWSVPVLMEGQLWRSREAPGP